MASCPRTPPDVGSAANSSIVDCADTLAGGAQSNSTLVNAAYTQFTDLSAYSNTHTGVALLGAPTTSGNWNIGTTAGVHLYTATSNVSTGNHLQIGCGTSLASACDPSDRRRGPDLAPPHAASSRRTSSAPLLRFAAHQP